MTFQKIITKTITELLDHEETRKILEDGIISLFEHEETRKILKECMLKAVLQYGRMTKL